MEVTAASSFQRILPFGIHLDITLCRLGKSPEWECRYNLCHTLLYLLVIQFRGWVRIYEFLFAKLRRVRFVGGFLLLWKGRVCSLYISPYHISLSSISRLLSACPLFFLVQLLFHLFFPPLPPMPSINCITLVSLDRETRCKIV